MHTLILNWNKFEIYQVHLLLIYPIVNQNDGPKNETMMFHNMIVLSTIGLVWIMLGYKCARQLVRFFQVQKFIVSVKFWYVVVCENMVLLTCQTNEISLDV